MKKYVGSFVKMSMVGAVLAATLFAFTGSVSANAAAAPAPCDVVGTPILTLTQPVTEPDSGNHGDWANDTFTENVSVWSATDGSGIFCAAGNTTDGKFVTTGPNSPGDGVSLAAGITGTFTGGETWILPAHTATTTLESSLTLAADNSTADGQFNNWQSQVFNGTGQNVGASTYSFTYTVDGDSSDTWTNADPASNPGGVNGDIANPSALSTVYVDGANGSDSNFGLQTTPFKTIQAAVNAVADGGTIMLSGDITVSSEVIINKALTLDGNGHTLLAPFAKTDNTNNAAIGILHADVTIENLVEDGTGSTGSRHGINIFEAVSNVNLNDVTVENNKASGVTINGSTVTVNNITTKNNAWGGINVDQEADAHDATVLNVTGISNQAETTGPDIWRDDNTKNVTVNDVANQYSSKTYTHDTSIVGTQYTLLEQGQTTPDDTGAATVTETNSQVVVTSPIQALTIETGSVANASVDLGALTTSGVATVPEITVNSNVAAVIIPATTITSSDTAWDGTISLPQIVTTTVDPVIPSGNTAQNVASIEVGSADSHLTFADAAKLVFAGQAGSLIGWSQTGGTFHEITACDASIIDQASATANLAADSDCKMDVNGDLVVWTKHFTTFTTYTYSATPATSGGLVLSAGGSNSGSSAGAAAVSTTATPIVGKVLGAETFFFNGDLTVGSQGTDVTELQNRLTAEGVYSGPITGYFGSLTQAAVKAYQAKMNIFATGYVGQITLASLNAAQAGNTNSAAAVVAVKGQLVALIQQLIGMLQSQISSAQ